MKNFSQIVLRTPLHSLSNSYQFNNKPSPLFEEGLYLSSTDFWQELQKKDSVNTKAKEKLELTFAKYWLRSCSRCTPYGTFAGSTVVNVTEDSTSVVLPIKDRGTRYVRLDSTYISAIVNALVKIPVIKEQLLFYPNNSIYHTPNGLRYVEYSIENNTRKYQLTSAHDSRYLKMVLQRAEGGATLQQLAELLVRENAGSMEEATGYVNELWLAQLLVPELEPTVTGAEPLKQIIGRLKKYKDVDPILNPLIEIQQLLDHPEAGTDYYIKIEKKLRQLDWGIVVPPNAIQVDMFLDPASATIDQNLLNKIITQTDDLRFLTRKTKIKDLENFKNKFRARYEEAVVPLSLALDGDLGIGYAGVSDQTAGNSEMVNELFIEGSSQAEGILNDHLKAYSVKKYNEWLREKKEYITLTEEELKVLGKNTEGLNFSKSTYLLGSLLKSEGRLDEDHFTFNLLTLGGPPAAFLLGRFTHGDKQIYQLSKDILEREEAEERDVIYAEVVHLPQARIGNIVLRPLLRKYEIPYVGLSGVDKEHQIPIDDLVLSLKGEDMILWSKKLNKRVIPRLTVAHNYNVDTSLPVYKFLCDLQMQHISFANRWDWGHLELLNHLPRVVYKNLILQKATWKIEEKDIETIPKEKAAYKDFFYKFRKERNMPQRVVYAEFDNELLIDFNEDVGIDLFLHYLKRHKKIKIEEFLFSDDNCIVHDADGQPYTNELIIPLYQPSPQHQETAITRKNTRGTIALHTENGISPKRIFSVYSEWLYFKIYCGAKSAEKTLSTIIHSFCEQAIADQMFEHFYFIRYNDENGGHIRIRFYNTDVNRQMVVYAKFMTAMQPYIDSGVVDKIVLDTYKREIERYTSQLMEAAEKLFYHDSIAVLRFLNLIDGMDAEKYRFLFALRGIDLLLGDFGYSLEQKAVLLKNLQSGFFREFGAHPNLQKQLNERYRKYQQFLHAHLDAAKDKDHEIEEAVELFQQRSAMNKDVIAKIHEKFRSGEVENRKLPELLESYIHMFMNRMFIAQQRKYELVVYHFLEKYYTSLIARSKKEQKDGIPVL